jgi:hypothetical protein
VALATMASMIFFSPAWAQENASDTPEEKPGRPVAEGVPARESTSDAPDKRAERRAAQGLLPQLGILLEVTEDYKLYGPDDPIPPDEHIEYNRTFPIGGEKLINRGYKLPLPYGLSIIGVHNTQDQSITGVNLTLGKGAVPPEDEELRPFPALNIESESVTQSIQLKADVWLLPFLNVFGTIGRVTGDASVNVLIDLADAPEICLPNPIPTRPPICSDNTFSGSFLLPIRSKVDRTTATLGLIGAYSIGSWFTTINGSYTDSYGDKATDISSISAGVRAGRRLFFGTGTLLTPFFGINYLDINTRVQGTSMLKNAFPDGDDLNVRYDIQLDNTDKYSGILGLAVGFTNGMAINFEWNKSADSERFVLSGNFRF